MGESDAIRPAGKAIWFLCGLFLVFQSGSQAFGPPFDRMMRLRDALNGVRPLSVRPRPSGF